MSTALAVKAANRRLYDAVADRYEHIDGRRGASLSDWIRTHLQSLSRETDGRVLLDLGSGSGVVTRAARGLFEKTIALDLSPRILAASGPIADWRIAADTDRLPLADESTDVISCFAVLHHLFDASTIAGEIARVLKPGGVFWSDHDMDAAFYRRFRWPLAVYRGLRGADRHYADAGGIDADTYRLAEYRENGVDCCALIARLDELGLRASPEFHWFGLTDLTNRIMGLRTSKRGWAPLLRIIARKPRCASFQNDFRASAR